MMMMDEAKDRDLKTDADAGAGGEDGPHLGQLYVYLTDGCNLACRHCWLAPRFDRSGEKSVFLPKDVFAGVIEEARPLGLNTIKLTGGEPLLHPDFGELVDIVRDGDLRLVMETNGLLCDAGVVNRIAGVPRRFVSVSIDGVDADTHDRVRGVAGSFEKACAAVRELAGAGVGPQIIMTLMRDNRDQVEAMGEMAERLGADSVKFNVLQPTARGRTLHEEFRALDIGTLIELGRRIEASARGAGGGDGDGGGNGGGTGSRLRLFFDYPPAFRSIRRIFDGDGGGVCGIFSILGLLADGHYALCGIGVHVPELVFGEAGKDRLEDVWQNNPVLEEIRKGLPERLEGICGRCLMKGMCLGACLAQNYYRGKNLWAPHWFCEMAADEGLFPESRLRPG